MDGRRTTSITVTLTPEGEMTLADAALLEALTEKGYKYSETKTVYDIESGKPSKVEKVVKYARPDTTAMIYWTKVKLNWHDGQYAPKPVSKEDLIEVAQAMSDNTMIEPTVKH